MSGWIKLSQSGLPDDSLIELVLWVQLDLFGGVDAPVQAVAYLRSLDRK